MKPCPLLLLVAAASLAIRPSPASADDLLDAVLQSDYPAAQPAAIPAPAPAPVPAAVPAFSSPAAPALPPAAFPPPAAGGTIGAASTPRYAPTAAKPRGASKKTFDTQLMDAFAGCCFFIRPKPLDKPDPDAGEPQPRTGYLP